MLYLLESDTRNVKWNGIPLHEATSAVIKEQMNGDFILTVRYPITDSEIYQLFREDMLIKAPAPVIGPQLFRIKKPVENDDHLEITAYHITDDVMQRSINPLSINKQSCWQALSQLVQVAKSPINDFSFTSDITDRRTINTKEVETLYSVLMDGAHSIVGTWEGELVRDNFAISIKRNRGEDRGVIISTHKNLKSYQRTKNSQNVVTRIHAKSTFKAEGAKEDTTIAITVDSPLISAYPYINERSYTNNNIQTVEELTKWASAKFTNEHIDKATDAIKIEAYELDGQTVHMGDTVNLKSYKHNVDVYKKAIAYEYDCLANNGQGAYLTITFDDKVKSGGNGGGVSAVANAILDKQETKFDIMLERAIANANRAFDAEFAKHEKDITDGIELAKAKAEEVKQELSDTINQRFDSFDNGPLKEAKRKAEEALRNAGASSLLAQEAKRIGLDSTAKLEEFKRQATSAQTALSGDLDALKRTVMNDIRPKQEQVTAEIAKQVEALVQTKKELAGVKSAQATYEETTTRRFAELTNLANGKASKSELTQTAEELASKIASVQASGRNLFLNSLFKQDISKTRIWTTSTYEVTIDSESKYLGHNALKIVGQDPMGRDGNNPKITYPALGQFGKVIAGSTTNQDITITFYAKANKNGIMLKSRLGNIWYKTGNVTLSTEIKRYVVHIPKSWTNESKLTTNEWLFTFNQEGTVWIWMPKFEISDVDTSYSEAPEDMEGQISAVESNFKQRADSLEAGVRSLTEGLRTKADISSLNVTAENIRQSVKSLETSTQNKLNQMLSMAEFEVRAGSIRQEILNATKDKADKTLVTAEAGKLREEFSNLRVGGRNLLRGSKGPFLPDRKPANFDNAILYVGQTSIYMEQGQEYIISAKTDGTFTAHHDGNKESDNVVLWIMDKDVRNYQIVSDLKTGTTGTKITWNKPTGIYHLRVNAYHKEATKSVWDVKIEKGNVATDWSPAPEDTDGLITEAKATFERTAQGLRTDLSAIQEYVNKDGQRQDALQRYTREESAKQATAVREQISIDYVGKSAYQEDVRGIERRFEVITNPKNGTIATQIANYKQSVDGRFTEITSLISGKANQTDFQRVKETSQLYERILGNTENGIADKVARMAMTNRLFQVEVSKNEGLKTIQRQLDGSWSVQNINSAGDLISGINLGANGHNRFDGKLTHITGETLIDKAVIKSAMIDKLKTANFEAGSVTTVILDAEAVTAEKLKVDFALVRKLTANDAFIEQLTSKRIFSTKVESVVSSSTFLEAYQGRIGGFTIGHFDQGRGRWISGVNQFSVGMGNGEGGSYNGENTAFWANWGYSWNSPGPNAWYVTTSGNMYCRNGADFHGKVDFSNRSIVNFYTQPSFSKGAVINGSLNVSGRITYSGGEWLYSPIYNKLWKDTSQGGEWLYLDRQGNSGRDWIQMNKVISDRRYKSNIQDSQVSGLDAINNLKTYSYRKEYDGKIEDITCGIMAQDVQKYAPEAFFENPDGAYSYRTFELVPYLIKAIQELNQKIEKMEKTIA